MANTNKLTDTISVALEGNEVLTEDSLKDHVKLYASIQSESFSDEEIEKVVRNLLSRLSTRMEIGTLFEAKDHIPWLAGRQADINPYYWNRYKNHLKTSKGFPIRIVHKLDQITDKILDRIEDPTKEGEWKRRGLVVGHVQSGKTANYTGLICKAADAGYQVIIVLAGLLNSLRNQTQERIDSDFMGWCTRTNTWIGASRFSNKRRPVCLTTVVEDFNSKTASTQLQLRALNEPIVLVLKKNKHSLERLRDWLSGQNQHDLREFSMLMIDDEADHASVNTNKQDKSPTTINLAIRDLLAIFNRSSYIGYTATPFANIFIDPENEDEMKNGQIYGDLFPRDFILSLDPPDNYVGPHRIFTEDSDLNLVRTIRDSEDYLRVKHKIDTVPESLPPSLVGAIECFVIAKGIRLLRGQARKHHSMMINASRFTAVQNILRGLVNEYVKDLLTVVNNYAALSPCEALMSSRMKSIYETWEREFSHLEFEWSQVQEILKRAIGPIEVISVNSSPSSDTLDYSDVDYPNGRSVIAVGGLGLSRGLTLEGLLVSYFLRNSIMYDTLMQMGRWFGYRDGYEDLCRIFMTDDAFDWYSHIAEATEELRSDFKGMEKAKLTPMQFGFRVRSHPTALIVTARNKMRSAREVPVSISLAGRLAETSVIFGSKKEIEANRVTLEKAISDASTTGDLDRSCKLGYLWKRVPASIIRNAVLSFQNHPECMLTYPDPLVEYIDWLSAEGHDKFDVLLRTVGENHKDAFINVAGFDFYTPIRTVNEITQSRIAFTKRRVASKGDEKAGLSAEEIAAVKDAHDGSNIPDKKYRAVAGRSPLMMVNFVAVREEDDGPIELIAPTFGLSFPGAPELARRREKTVQYRVNTIWWEKNFFMPEEEEEED